MRLGNLGFLKYAVRQAERRRRAVASAILLTMAGMAGIQLWPTPRPAAESVRQSDFIDLAELAVPAPSTSEHRIENRAAQSPLAAPTGFEHPWATRSPSAVQMISYETDAAADDVDVVPAAAAHPAPPVWLTGEIESID